MKTLHAATLDDAVFIDARLRAIDRLECRLSDYPDDIAASLSVALSHCAWTVREDGTPICMFGVVPLLPGVGSLWLLATDEFDEHHKDLLRISPPQVARLHSHFPTLMVHVARENEKSRRFLRWLGFREADPPLTEVPHSMIQMVKTADV